MRSLRFHRPLVVILAVVFALQSAWTDPLVAQAAARPAAEPGPVAPAQDEPSPEPTAAPSESPPVPSEPPSDQPPLPPIEPAELPSEPVEVVAERTAESRTFQNPDGTFTTESYGAPIHYADASGALVPIEAEPVASETEGVAFETKSGPVAVRLGVSSVSGQPLSVVAGDYSVGFRPIALPAAEVLPLPPGLPASPAPVAQVAPADRAPALDQGQVVYPDVFPGVDLRYTLLAHGVKEDIVLTQPGALSSFAFALDAPGLTPTLNADGSITLGTADAPVFIIPTPFMVDSAPEEDGDGARSTAVSYRLLDLDGQTVVVVDADPTWLADPARVYPVYIDPAVLLYETLADTFISSGYPNNSFNTQWNPNEGGYYELWNGTYDAYTGINYAFVRTAIPSGVTVLGAEFKIYVQHAYAGGSPTSILLGKLTSAFNVNQTWNQSGTNPGWVHLTSTTVADNQWAVFNVTGLAREWIYGQTANHGVHLRQESTNAWWWKRLRASESNGTNPHLRVTWTRPSVAPTSPVSNAWGKGTFNWTYNSEGSGLAQARYWVQVSRSPTNFSGADLLIDSGASSGSAWSWTAPNTGMLTSGSTYYWRVSVGDGHSWSGFSAAQTWRFDAAAPSFSSVGVGGAVTAADPNFYDLGNGSMTVAISGHDPHSGIQLTYLRLYNATNELRVVHNWNVSATHCDEFDTSTLADVTACAQTFNSGGTREVTFTVVGLNANASFDVQWYFADNLNNVVGYGDTGKDLHFDATAPAGAITSPSAGSTLSGIVSITGTASDANFTQYELHYGAGSNPSTWSDLGTNPRTVAVTSGTLGTWNTTSVADGTYTIRLRVYDRARVTSGFTEVTRTVTVDNASPTAIVATPTGERLEDGTLQVTGTASSTALFANYTLHYGVGCSPASWSDIGANPRSSPVTNGSLGIWDATGLAGPHTVRLVVNRSDGGIASDTVCVNLGTALGRQAQHTFEGWDLGAGDELSVNAATGNAVVTHPLITLPYRGDALSITLTYNSHAVDNVGLGSGWQLNLQRRLVVHANGAVTFVDGDGARHLFSDPVTDGAVTTYTRPATVYATLVKDTGQATEFTLTYRDGSRDAFDLAGSGARLVRWQDRHLNGIDLTYGTGDQIAQVTDPAGRAVDFAWSAGRLESITDWAWIDGAGVVQASATGSRRTYRFFHDGGLLAGWSDPLNTAGSCPSGGSHLTCLAYTSGRLTAITKTQTVTTFSAGALGTATRAITTAVAYASDGRVSSVTDAEQQALAGPSTTFTWETPTRVRVNRPTTTTTYGLVAAGDRYARIASVWRHLDASTLIERRTTWDANFPTEPASVTDNATALASTPARTISYTYLPNSLGLVSRMVEPLTDTTSRWTEYAYNAANDVTQMTVSQDGSATLRTVTRYCYSADCEANDGRDLLRQIDNWVLGATPDNDTSVAVDYGYDGFGQRIRTTRHNRDAAGAVLDDRVDAFTYDAFGNVTAEIVNRADGAVTGGYDVDPDLATQARTDLTTTHTYDTAGNRISSADPRRAILAATGSPAADDYLTRWTYDAMNQQLSERTPTTPGLASAQRTLTSAYDELGLTRTASDFGSLITATEYDRAGRALRTFEDPTGAPVAAVTSAATYDADGRAQTKRDRRQVADAALGSTTYGYDGLGRQTSMIEAAGTSAEALTTTGYDALDRRTSYVVGGQDTRYSHDLGGRVTATDDGFTCKTEIFDYRDLATSTTHGRNGNGCGGAGQYTVTHTHDGLRRLTRDENGALRPLDDTFDAAGNRRRSSPVTDNGSGGTTSVVTDFAVNLLDQVITETRMERATSRTAKTTYDAAGNATNRCRWDADASVGDCLAVGTTPWPNAPSHATTTGYDARSQRISLADATTQQTTLYDPAHNYQAWAVYLPLGGGVEHQTLSTYDERHRLIQLVVRSCAVDAAHACVSTPVVLGSDTYAYDDNDNRTQVVESRDGATSTDHRYCYDARNQLVFRNTGASCSAAAHDEAYTYDDAGNRLTAMQGGNTRTFNYTADGQYTGATHDASGRITEWDNWRFLAYDANGRLTEVCDWACSTGSVRLYFTYDADGRRTKITYAAGGSSTTTELRYADGRISAEYVDGVLTRQYVTDEAGAVVKMTIPTGQANAGTYLVTWNGHGDALNLLHVNGATLTLANSFSYDTWGAATVHTHNGFPDLAFRFRYVGQFGVQDDQLYGLPLQLMGARHYLPSLGRFIQPDPAESEPNKYAYAGNNPVSYLDPSGEAFWFVALAVVALAVARVLVTRAAIRWGFPALAASFNWSTFRLQIERLNHIWTGHNWWTGTSSRFGSWMNWFQLVWNSQGGQLGMRASLTPRGWVIRDVIVTRTYPYIVGIDRTTGTYTRTVTYIYRNGILWTMYPGR